MKEKDIKIKASVTRWNAACKRYATFSAVSFMLIVILALLLPTPPAASSESAVDYFNIAYDPMTFSKTDIVRDEAFSVTFHGNATCTDDLPPIQRGRIIGRVVAKNISTGHEIVINSQYTLNVDPFPEDPGEYLELTVTVPLQFPANDIPGDYSVVGETIKAEVYLLGDWEDVTDTVPADHVLGSVHYATSGATSTPAATLTPTSTPGASTSPTVTATAGTSATPSVSPGPTGTTMITATPAPTGTATGGAPSPAQDGSASSGYGAPVWAAIGLAAALMVAIITLVIMRMPVRSKTTGKSNGSDAGGDSKKP